MDRGSMITWPSSSSGYFSTTEKHIDSFIEDLKSGKRASELRTPDSTTQGRHGDGLSNESRERLTPRPLAPPSSLSTPKATTATKAKRLCMDSRPDLTSDLITTSDLLEELARLDKIARLLGIDSTRSGKHPCRRRNTKYILTM